MRFRFFPFENSGGWGLVKHDKNGAWYGMWIDYPDAPKFIWKLFHWANDDES